MQHVEAVVAERAQRSAVVAVQVGEGDGHARDARKRAAAEQLGKGAFAAVEQKQAVLLPQKGGGVARRGIKRRAAAQKMKFHANPSENAEIKKAETKCLHHTPSREKSQMAVKNTNETRKKEIKMRNFG